MKKFNLLVIFFFLFSTLCSFPLTAETESLTPGLYHSFDFRKGQYQIYLPTSYNPENKAPLIVISHLYDGVNDKDPSIVMNSWSREADERGYVILWAHAGGILRKIDEWYLELIELIKKKYSINASRVLITGFGEGADYAAFHATNRPESISAVAVVAGTHQKWEKMSRYRSERKPFYVVSIQDDRLAKAEKIDAFVAKLKKKGYAVTHEKIEKGGHVYTDDITSKISAWFQAL